MSAVCNISIKMLGSNLNTAHLLLNLDNMLAKVVLLVLLYKWKFEI